MKAVKIMVVAIISTALVIGCARKPNAQEECVRQMQWLWEACRSYHFAENIPADQPIDPTNLNGFFGPEYQNMKCPLGTRPYPPFTYRNGPQCPSSVAHTRALHDADKSRSTGTKSP